MLLLEFVRFVERRNLPSTNLVFFEKNWIQKTYLPFHNKPVELLPTQPELHEVDAEWNPVTAKLPTGDVSDTVRTPERRTAVVASSPRVALNFTNNLT